MTLPTSARDALLLVARVIVGDVLIALDHAEKRPLQPPSMAPSPPSPRPPVPTPSGSPPSSAVVRPTPPAAPPRLPIPATALARGRARRPAPNTSSRASCSCKSATACSSPTTASNWSHGSDRRCRPAAGRRRSRSGHSYSTMPSPTDGVQPSARSRHLTAGWAWPRGRPRERAGLCRPVGRFHPPTAGPVHYFRTTCPWPFWSFTHPSPEIPVVAENVLVDRWALGDGLGGAPAGRGRPRSEESPEGHPSVAPKRTPRP